MSTGQCNYVRPSDELYAARVADRRTRENMQGNGDHERFTDGRNLATGFTIGLGIVASLLLYYGGIVFGALTLVLCTLSAIAGISFEIDRKRVYQKEFDIQYDMAVERVCSSRHEQTKDE